jgi:ribonuclease HI
MEHLNNQLENFIIEPKGNILNQEMTNCLPLESFPSFFSLHFSGACKGNPGPGAGGYVVKNVHSDIVFEGGIYLENTTNNEAFYYGLIEGLKRCIDENVKLCAIKSDSLIHINQMKGEWKVKNFNMIGLYEQARKYLKKAVEEKFTYVHLGKNDNREASLNSNRIILNKKRI